MKINSVSSSANITARNEIKGLSKIESVNKDNFKPQFAVISFKGNPDKHPWQVGAYATESNYLGGIYCAGGLGDVAEALPESMAKHGSDVIGRNVDVRTFLPYYSLDDAQGRLYVAKPSAKEKMQNKAIALKELALKNLSKEKNNAEKKAIEEKFKLSRSNDFMLVEQGYKLKDGESFALITQASGQGAEKVDKVFLLKDVNLSGQADRVAKDSFDLEKIPYRIFEVETNGQRKDRMYLIHTPEMASGKSAYGIYGKYAEKAVESSVTSSTTYGPGKTNPTVKTGKYFQGRAAGDMFYTEQLRAMEQSLEKMGTEAHGDFVPQSILLHDRFAYSMLTDGLEKMGKGDKYWTGIRYVPIFHNPGRSYQGCFENPIDFFKIVATQDDLADLKANKYYGKVNELSEKIGKGTATREECTQIYNFFKPYYEKYLDSEGCFNMTKIAINTADEYPENCIPGNVSKYFGKEARNFETEDIAKGLTQDMINIESKTLDVVNGGKPANMATNVQDGFFGSGSLNNIFKDVKDERKYTPFATTDSVEKIYEAKQANKRNLINIIADATDKSESDKDAIAKVFFSEKVMKDNRGANADLKLTLGGLSKYKDGDVLFLSWGRPDPQKGLKVTARAFRMFLEDESIPLETREHAKLLFGAGKNVFRDGNTEWEGIKEELDKIANIEVNGKKGFFKGNACYVNGLFPNRLANCTDAAIFTSRWEPCGITPFESFSTGTPVINIKSGGAPDFITPGKNGLLTKDSFMLSASKLGLEKDVAYDVLDEARCQHAAKDTAETIKQYMNPLADNTFEAKQKEYIQNCLNEKVEWHNNNAYNGGRSALDLYLKDRCRTQDNNVGTMFRSNGRGKFDESVFSKETNGVGHFVRRNKVATSVVLGLTALVGLGIACNKAGLFNGAKKTTSDQKQHLSHLA